MRFIADLKKQLVEKAEAILNEAEKTATQTKTRNY